MKLGSVYAPRERASSDDDFWARILRRMSETGDELSRRLEAMDWEPTARWMLKVRNTYHPECNAVTPYVYTFLTSVLVLLRIRWSELQSHFRRVGWRLDFTPHPKSHLQPSTRQLKSRKTAEHPARRNACSDPRPTHDDSVFSAILRGYLRHQPRSPCLRQRARTVPVHPRGHLRDRRCFESTVKQVTKDGSVVMEAPRLRRTRLVCISDTHNCTPKLPKGDVLIHAGDLTNQGSYSEVSFTDNE